MNVCILGCGPSGLLAAEACAQQGHKVLIVSQAATPSPILGAQYLHEEIPGVTEEDHDGVINYHKVGTGSGYALKVYGREDAPTSWSIFPEGEHPCWNLLGVYTNLWDKWHDSIRVAKITDASLEVFNGPNFRRKFNLVISSIPAHVLCKNPEHKFPFVNVAFEDRVNGEDKNLGDNYVYYSGDPGDSWYRSSWIFDSGYWEYAGNGPTDRERNLRRGIKPLNTDCDCRPSIVRIGRFGEWKKSRLLHHSFNKTLDALELLDAVH